MMWIPGVHTNIPVIELRLDMEDLCNLEAIFLPLNAMNFGQFPKDYGNCSDIRWVKVQDEQGKGLMISGDIPLNFSLHKYTTDNLARALYTYQLEEARHTILNLDYRVSGVGGTALRQLQAYREQTAVGHYTIKVNLINYLPNLIPMKVVITNIVLLLFYSLIFGHVKQVIRRRMHWWSGQ